MSTAINIIIINAIFIQVIPFGLGQSEYITVLNVNPVSNGNSQFQCYTPSTYSEYMLSYGRSFGITNDDQLSEISWSGRSDHKYATSSFNMGVYFCQITIDGKTTTVQTTKIRSDAEITPSNSRSTLTVNVGDDATIRFNGEPEWDVNWRKNGALLNDDATKEKSMTFNPVNTNDAGIYEVYRVGRRSERRHSFINLIVRACPRHKWGPPDCTRDCEYCYNGGVCNEITGICICAPGFMGTTCKTGCGGNKHSWNCETYCTFRNEPYACRNHQFCLPDPYGCSCVTGFKGLACNSECESGKFGADCAQSCHCNKGECDRYTGRCTDTEDSTCAHPWTGDNCQECQPPYYGENCELKCTKPCECHRGTGNCIGGCYSNEWLEPDCEIGILNATFLSANNGHQTSVYCTIYNGGTEDVQPLVMIISSGGTENIAPSSSTSIEQNIIKYAFLVTSELYSTYRCVLVQGSIVAQMDIIPGIFLLPSYNGYMKMVTATSSSISIEWTAWNNKTDDGDGPIMGYYLNYKMSNANNWENKQYQQSLSGTVTGLMSDKSYTFAVSAVRPGEGGEGPVGKQQLTVKIQSDLYFCKDGISLSSVAIGFGVAVVFMVLIVIVALKVWTSRANDTRRNDSRDQNNATEGKEPSVYYNSNPYQHQIKPMAKSSKNSTAGFYANDIAESNSGFVTSNEVLNKPTNGERTYCEIRNTHA